MGGAPAICLACLVLVVKAKYSPGQGQHQDLIVRATIRNMTMERNSKAAYLHEILAASMLYFLQSSDNSARTSSSVTWGGGQEKEKISITGTD